MFLKYDKYGSMTEFYKNIIMLQAVFGFMATLFIMVFQNKYVRFALLFLAGYIIGSL